MRESIERRKCDCCGKTKEAAPTSNHTAFSGWIEVVKPTRAGVPMRLDFCSAACLIEDTQEHMEIEK